MAAGRMLKASLAVLLPAGVAATCFKEGFEYRGHEVVLPGYVMTADDCAFQCKITVYCAFFTFKKEANWTHPHGSGACLKFDHNVTLGVAPGPANLTVSGALSCAVPTADPLPIMTPVSPPSLTLGLPAVPNVSMPNVSMPNASLCTNGTCVPSLTKAGGGGGFPWWAILLILLVIAGVAGAVLYGSCDEGKKKKKSKAKKSKKEKFEEAAPSVVEAGEVQSLVRTEAPPPMIAEPVSVMPDGSAAAAAPIMTSQPQMMTTVPAAATTYMQAQPVMYTSGSPVMTSQVQMQQPLMSGVQMVSGGARQPQFR